MSPHAHQAQQARFSSKQLKFCSKQLKFSSKQLKISGTILTERFKQHYRRIKLVAKCKTVKFSSHKLRDNKL